MSLLSYARTFPVVTEEIVVVPSNIAAINIDATIANLGFFPDPLYIYARMIRTLVYLS
jgi:hypothetical protein